MMKWIFASLLLFVTAVAALPVPDEQGKFTVIEDKNGYFTATFQGTGLKVSSIFPGEPTLSGDVATFKQDNPPIQLTLLVSLREEPSLTEMARAMLNVVTRNYAKLNIQLVDVRTLEPEETKGTNSTTFSQQFILDTEEGMREFLQVQITRGEKYDVMTFSRLILTSMLANQPELRTKENSIVHAFHKSINISFTP